jgi:hypothetical protein
MQDTQKPLTLGELTKRTGAKFYQVTYLDRLGKLEKEVYSSGSGNKNIYKESAIDVILAHVKKSGGKNGS